MFRNIPVTEWGLQKSATAYMGLGTYFGYFTAQNGRGHVLGHVKDLSAKADPNDKTVSLSLVETLDLGVESLAGPDIPYESTTTVSYRRCRSRWTAMYSPSPRGW